MRKDRLVGEVLGEENTLSPSDLYNPHFKTAVVRGYDRKEVDAFLERVGDVFEALLNQVRELRKEIDDQRVRLDEAREMEDTLREALVAAQRLREETVAHAEREAASVREEAKLVLARAKQQARELPATLRAEIIALKEARNRVRADLEAVLETHRALVERIPHAEAADLSEELEPETESFYRLQEGHAPPIEEAPEVHREPWVEEGNSYEPEA